MKREDGSSWRDSLIAKVVFFLSLTLLPIGFIAIFQTRELTRESDLRSELALLALTEKASSPERKLVERAFGAAQMLAATLDVVAENPTVCRTYLEQFLSANKSYSFVGVVPLDGVMTCTSDGMVYDLSGSDNLSALLADPRPIVDTSQIGGLDERSVISANQPFYRDDALAGFVTIAIPHSKIEAIPIQDPRASDVHYVTFNAQGEVLTSTKGLLELAPTLPADMDLMELVGQDARTFSAKSRDGERRVFASVPIVPRRIYALSSWSASTPLTPSLGTALTAMLFPFFMWIASIFVASFALNRLVLRPVQGLGRKMRRFARDRRFEQEGIKENTPKEFAQMQADFEAMASSLIQDEAELQDALHDIEKLLKEKDILLKEVHHRVKNNLQMISSIMNMQIRQTQNPETKNVLRSLQERVMTLASIHRNLYQTENFDAIDAGALLRELVRQMLVMARVGNVDVTTKIDNLVIYPDQAVPLSLLVSEAVTNALKSVNAVQDGEAFLNVTLNCKGEFVTLIIENSLDPETPSQTSGMGTQLIEAFATQLEADLRMEAREDRYVVNAVFERSTVSPQLTDH